MNSIPDKLDIHRTYKNVKGLKAEKTVHRVTFTPSTADPGATLNISIPRFSKNVVMVPGSFGLLFTLKLTHDSSESAKQDANRLVVNNLGRNLVSSMRVDYGGETLSATERFDLFHTYSDLFAMKEERGNMMREGVSSVNIRKMRTGAGDAPTTPSNEVALATVYGTRYRIPLCHPIIDSQGTFYPREMTNALTFQITLPESTGITTHADTKLCNYSLTNMELEYECISSAYLAREASLSYQVGKDFYYENVLRYNTFNFDDHDDILINQKVSKSRRSMTGILLLFTKAYVAGTRDTESFVNPGITKVDVNIDGMPNKLYSKGMIPSDFWDAIINRMGLTDNVTQIDFYDNKFALWIDLRSYPDDSIHGNGLMLNETKDGVKLEITRTQSGSTGDTTTCHMFVVADAMVTIKDKGLLNVVY